MHPLRNALYEVLCETKEKTRKFFSIFLYFFYLLLTFKLPYLVPQKAEKKTKE